jgi:hypothetical protein
VQDNQSHSHYLIWKYDKINSIKNLFKRYYEMFVRVYFGLEKLHQNFSKNYSIKVFNELLLFCNRFPKIKMASVKKDIETHKETQFLSNYNCETYIALPLIKAKVLRENDGSRIHLKRYEGHIHRFQDEFFPKLEREIKHNIYLLDRNFFTEKDHETKSLVQLLVVNCTESAVECEGTTGMVELLKFRDIQKVPKAPVIILFGVNVKSLAREI